MSKKSSKSKIAKNILLGLGAVLLLAACDGGKPPANTDQPATQPDTTPDTTPNPQPTTKVCRGDFLVNHTDTAGDLDKIKDCTEITGSLRIQSTKLTDLDSLKNLNRVGGRLDIGTNRHLTNIDGLKSLTAVGGNLYISVNHNLLRLEGLKNLTTIGGWLWIAYNDSLTNLDGLKNITTVTTGLYVYANNNLVNIEGLRNVKLVKSYLHNRQIYNNPKLDCTPYNSNPFAFFPLTHSYGNKVNCTTR